VIVGGTADALVAPEHLDRYRAVYGDRLELHLIEGADHGFSSVPARETLVDVTMEFLTRNAV
jgi:surfactin synthase thioesterase subunit